LTPVQLPTRLAGAVAALVAAAGLAPPSAAADLDHPMLGEPAPAFTLPSLTGEVISLPDFRGKYLVIHFGTSW